MGDLDLCALEDLVQEEIDECHRQETISQRIKREMSLDREHCKKLQQHFEHYMGSDSRAHSIITS